jgi:hypothetical protein
MQLKIFGLVGAGIFCAATLIHPLNAFADKKEDHTRAAWTPPLLLSELRFLGVKPLGWNDECDLKYPDKYSDYIDSDLGCCIIGKNTSQVQKDFGRWDTCKSNAKKACDFEPEFRKNQPCNQ